MISLSRTSALSPFFRVGPSRRAEVTTIRPCRALQARTSVVKVDLPQPSRRRSVAGGGGIVILRRRRPGSRSTIASDGWSSVSRTWRAFICFARAWTCDPWPPSGRRGVRKANRKQPTAGTMRASTSKTSPPMRSSATTRALAPGMPDNPGMRRLKPRWLAALLGGIVLPFDPVLGLVIVIIGMSRPKRRPRPRVLQP